TGPDLSLGIGRVLEKIEPCLIPEIALVSLSTSLAANAIMDGIRSPINVAAADTTAIGLGAGTATSVRVTGAD
ncbi:MAG: hypothetical protein JRH07_11245, partial [Deltaproteobacteria bacterium]|nr:hypothetical protein [Deltaproteobacteria bacterium]